MPEMREATASDADAVEQVWAAVAAEGEWIGTELPLRPGWQARFCDAIASPEAAWFVADEEGEIIGGIVVHGDSGLAHIGMAIVEGHRGRGVGRALLDAAIAWAQAAGCHKVALEVWPHNARARTLYKSAGFREEGYLTRHYRRKNGELWDAIAMGLTLDHDSPSRP
jgi:RimJ/RimL family protein N-acetyltransferase